MGGRRRRIITRTGSKPSVWGGNRQDSGHIHQKRRVLAARSSLEQYAIDADMRILDDVLRKFRNSDQLYVVRRQAMMAFGRRVDVDGPIQRQHRYMVHTVGGRVVAKSNMPGQRILDRLLEQTGTVAYDTAGQPKIRADE